MGWLPVTARLVSRLRLAAPVNAVNRVPALRRLLTRAGGLADREVSRFARQTLRQWHAPHAPRGDGHLGTVMLWPDTFTNYFHPHVEQAALQVLEQAGWRTIFPNETSCCALTFISTGQLATARRILSRTFAQLAPHMRGGGYVVGPPDPGPESHRHSQHA